jgi:two-component system sensor histidine kinase DesK
VTGRRRLPFLPDSIVEELGWTPYGWLLYLPSFWVSPVLGNASVSEWVGTVAATGLFLVLYFRGYSERGWGLAAIAAVIAGVGFLFFPLNPGALVFFIYAGAFLGTLHPPRFAFLLLGVLGGLVALAIWWLDFHWLMALPAVGVTLLVGATNVHYVENARKNADLRRAHEEIERLAKVAERERIGRDLHDLLGHTLSLIVLKSELASKLADRDPERAATEIREVEAISRDALRQVRQAVRGFRPGEASLRQEAENARRALESAGVEPEIDLALDAPPPDVDRIAALAVREGVTNVIRHAGARRCRVSLRHEGEAMVLEIEDDGRGERIEEGSGLRGMRERVESVGGNLEVRVREGVMLRVVLPRAATGSLGTPS